MKHFFSEAAIANKHNIPMPQNIDGRCDTLDICNLLSDKYIKIF